MCTPSIEKEAAPLVRVCRITRGILNDNRVVLRRLLIFIKCDFHATQINVQNHYAYNDKQKCPKIDHGRLHIARVAIVAEEKDAFVESSLLVDTIGLPG